ncbi:uncharacterized protein LOC128989045 [Macrosteles quadrilineatus]|uniref:uncharacterized protein LOC128989045 n=1 Tax=Macrosteles quadrilineatus TaxID=74068 RepID=UPI0023E243FF|nr:uncharacterized protein LOC128989045 [Macrosteles quadrilineatus]
MPITWPGGAATTMREDTKVLLAMVGADKWANKGAHGSRGDVWNCLQHSTENSVCQWMGIEHRRSWGRTEGNVQSKRMLQTPTGAFAADALGRGKWLASSAAIGYSADMYTRWEFKFKAS